MYKLTQMDANNIIAIKDGVSTRPAEVEAPSVADMSKQKLEVTGNRKKRRRGKYKRKIMKPFTKIPWQDRRRMENCKRNNRFRKIVLAKTHAPFNNNQFLMEIHKPEPENTFHITPSARTRDSSFSVDSEDNYFYSLPEDEEEYLTKEFSSVYEDAQSERLSNMSKDDLIQEYLLLEAKYDNLVKRTERSKPKGFEEDKDMTVTDKDPDPDASYTDRDSMITDRDTSGTSIGSSAVDEQTYSDLLQRMKDQEEQINVLQLDVEKLRHENEFLRQHSQASSSEDSESDSSSTSDSDSSSGRSASVVDEPIAENGTLGNENHDLINGQTEETEECETIYPMINGSHDDNE